MNSEGKRNQLRQSWWSASSEGQSWLSRVRQRVARQSSAAAKPDTRFGATQVKSKSV
ncbi:MAG: hypothetical protein GY727_15800 [Gammaproteobacteria bacterium]|nr:hypothetical protein [Gammaproteobacteria bacterium]MCP4089106.1 hypothetical protein [Gammaproteobacteria bacterium]MCP4276869.1 hypothetical protein [Gammaproteobacteria bacterium]MCP4830712.1 hypothetical protein [Gammaproteobacteria bacterium]MCP4928864.1 hypothetical protein [Gammaproteobacteria bacterium]